MRMQFPAAAVWLKKCLSVCKTVLIKVYYRMAWLKKLAKKDPLPLSAAPAIAAETVRAACILARRHTPIHAAILPIHGSDFHNGDFLRKFTEHAVTQSIKFLGKPKCCSGLMQVASVCTGSAMDCLALDALSSAMNREGLDMGFEICLNCELRAETDLDQRCAQRSAPR